MDRIVCAEVHGPPGCTQPASRYLLAVLAFKLGRLPEATDALHAAAPMCSVRFQHQHTYTRTCCTHSPPWRRHATTRWDASRSFQAAMMMLWSTTSHRWLITHSCGVLTGSCAPLVWHVQMLPGHTIRPQQTLQQWTSATWRRLTMPPSLLPRPTQQ